MTIEKRAVQGTLMQVGIGAVIPNGVLGNPVLTGSIGGGQPKGCVSYLRFQKSAEDIQQIIVDGNSYSGGNLNEFREVLLDASLAMKCVSFCWDSEKTRDDDAKRASAVLLPV